MPSEVHIEAPSRLHFGFAEIGEDGILCGSAGVALDNPVLRFTLQSSTNTCTGECSSEISRIASDAVAGFGTRKQFGTEVHEHIPRHVGFGSGTQMYLGAGVAAYLLSGREPSPEKLAEDMKRGRRSRVGIMSFVNGGFSIDASDGQRSLPMPSEWRFVIAVPSGHPRIHGVEEKRLLSRITTYPPSEMRHMLTEARMDLVAGLEKKDIELFGRAISRMDTITGEIFSQTQGGLYTNPLVSGGLKTAMLSGALGGGQSSWGPGFFALCEDETSAQKTTLKLAEYMDQRGGGDIFCSPARNTGARITAL